MERSRHEFQKPSKAAWPLVCLPKKQGGLGVINISSHNEALLLKFLHKFYSKAPIPWVRLVWDKYYSNGKMPGQQKKGSFWWHDVVSLIDSYKRLTTAMVADGSSILHWTDFWNGIRPMEKFPELASFAINPNITVKELRDNNSLFHNFHLPLSSQAFQQLGELEEHWNQAQQLHGHDQWIFQWGNSTFSSSKIYKALIGQRPTHPAFLWLWKSKCQMKHKVFFWLVLMVKVNTRGTLRRRNMILDSYTCEMCIRQRPETISHLFLRCSFAKECWQSIGVTYVTTRPLLQIFKRIKENLQHPFFMEIIILMTWSIWNTRNETFNNVDPSIQSCRQRFMLEFYLASLRAPPILASAMTNWSQTL